MTYVRVSRIARQVSIAVVALLVLTLVTGLSGPKVEAASPTAPTPAWKETGLFVPTESTSYCQDGTRPNTLLVANRTPGFGEIGTYEYNLTTGIKKKFSSRTFNVCNEATGWLFTDDNTATRFGLADPDGKAVGHIPTHTAADGSLIMYELGEPTKNIYSGRLSVSLDAGKTWQVRGPLPNGRDYQSLAVVQSDARTLYAMNSTALPNGNRLYTIFFSSDTGLTWEKRAEREVAGSSSLSTSYSLAALGGRNAPANLVTVVSYSGGGSSGAEGFQLSSDGGRIFPTTLGYNSLYFKIEFYHTPFGLVRLAKDSSKYTLSITADYSNWQEVPLPFTFEPFNIDYGPLSLTLRQAPNDPANLFLSYAGGFGDLWHSANSGRTWQKLIGNQPTVLISPNAPQSLLALDKNSQVLTLPLPELDRTQTDGVRPIVGVGSDFYAATNHNLSGVFKKYWQQHGGLAEFGYPRTEPFRELNPSDGKVYLVQYFERNRFEYHPELVGTPYEVLLGLLGNQLTEERRILGDGAFNRFDNANYPGGTYFPQTGHNLRNSFKVYWEANGGLALYGLPISEELYEVNPDDGKTYVVQYFERNRFEFHPEFVGTRYEVLLGLLGNSLLKNKGWL